jgi:hypothetical protein
MVCLCYLEEMMTSPAKINDYYDGRQLQCYTVLKFEKMLFVHVYAPGVSCLIIWQETMKIKSYSINRIKYNEKDAILIFFLSSF